MGHVIGRLITFAAVILATVPLPAAAQGADYVVGPRDVLVVAVSKQPQLSGSYTVTDDGRLDLPLIGHVSVAGLTRTAVEAAVRTRLADGYVLNPDVSVTVEQYRSQKVFVTGEVNEPGAITLPGTLTLLEALARAGSLTEHAGREAVIARPTRPAADDGPAAFDGTSQILRVDLPPLQRGDLSRNLGLRDGDTVFVPRAATIHVLGAVRNPGEYPVFPDTRVAELIARAGGTTERGSTRRLRIIRVVGDDTKELKAQLDDRLQPRDVLFVLERIF